MKKTAVFEYYPETIFIPLRLADGTENKVEIVPGQAFGRGFHPTTKLCIKALEKIFSDSAREARTIDTVLDVGCGSGVLSICAAMLGAREVTGLDIDNMIVTEALENVSKNIQESKVSIFLGSVEEISGEFDLVTANVLIDSMLPMSGELAARVRSGGLLLLSGIKNQDSEIVIDSFTGYGLKLLEKNIDCEWTSMLLSNQNPGTGAF